MSRSLDRRGFLEGAAALSLGSLLRQEPRNERPNVLWIVSDQHRADFTGYAGHSTAVTPSLDTLARQGTWIRDVYCQAPLCFPSRQSMLTGQYLFHHGSYRNWHRPPLEQVTLPHALRDEGYETVLIGKDHCNTGGFTRVEDQTVLSEAFLAANPEARFPGQGSYERSRDEDSEREFVDSMNPRYETAGDGPVFFLEEIIADRAGEFLRERSSEEPFFLWASFLNPHPPLFPPEEYLERFAEVDVPLLGSLAEEEPGLFAVLQRRRRLLGLDRLDQDILRNVTRAYLASLAYTDACIGRLLTSLEECGLGQDTLVIYTSDHGEMLGQHGLLQKQNFYEGAVRVPALVRWPGRVAAERRLDVVAQHVDLTATVAEWTGVEMEGDGRSMAGLLTGTTEAPWESMAYSELLTDGVRRPKVPPGSAPGALPAGLGFMLRMGSLKWIRYVDEGEALFDLEADPGELHNLIEDPERAKELAALRDRFEALRPEAWRVLPVQSRDWRPKRGRDR